jgi:hypothetical protein
VVVGDGQDEEAAAKQVRQILSRLLEEPSLTTTLQGVYFIFILFRSHLLCMLANTAVVFLIRVCELSNLLQITSLLNVKTLPLTYI